MPGLISNSDETAYRAEVDSLVNWCDQNNLVLNTSKTHEVIIDFRRNRAPITPLIIKGEEIKQEPQAKFLGTTISAKLSWNANCSAIKKKTHKRLYFFETTQKVSHEKGDSFKILQSCH